MEFELPVSICDQDWFIIATPMLDFESSWHESELMLTQTKSIQYNYGFCFYQGKLLLKTANQAALL